MAGAAVYTVGAGVMCWTRSGYSDVRNTRGIIVAGAFSAVNEFNIPGIAKLTREGFLDSTFNPGTGFTGGLSGVTGLCDIDGDKFFAVGDFTAYNGTTTIGAAIVNGDGTLAVAFSPGPRSSQGGNHDGNCFRVIKRGDGKFYIVGGFDHFAGDLASDAYNQIVCVDSTGAVDSTFQSKNFPTLFVADAGGHWSLQAYYGMTIEIVGGALTNRVLAVGLATTINGLFTDSGIGLALYNANGSQDTAFRDNTLIPLNAGGSVPAMTCCNTQPDGKYLIGGAFTTWLGDTAKPYVARLSASGALDGTFNTNAGTISNTNVGTIGVQTGIGGSKIVIGGNFFGAWGLAQLQRSCIARLNTNGEVESLTIPGVTSGAF